MSPTDRFTDAVVVVTGAAHGIVRGIAAHFAAESAHVVLVDRAADVHTTASEIAGDFAAETDPRAGSVEGRTADVTDEDQVQATFDAIVHKYGRVDVLVNNAGTITISRLEELSLANWNRVLAVNTTGVFLCARAGAAAMRATGDGGRILNAASGQARQGFKYTPHYAASKFGVVGLTQSPMPVS